MSTSKSRKYYIYINYNNILFIDNLSLYKTGRKIKLLLKQSGNQFLCSLFENPGTNNSDVLTFGDNPETNKDISEPTRKHRFI